MSVQGAAMGLIRKTHQPGAHVGTWQFAVLIVAMHMHRAAALNFNTYGPCEWAQDQGASVPQCRRQAGIPAGEHTVAVSAVPQQLPVDMRLPCEDVDSECHQNVDVVNSPLPPQGPHIANCSYELMPWSPFPCSYNANSSSGVPGQATDLCTSPLPGVSQSFAKNLTTDGYNNLYFGVLPSSFCSEGSKVARILLKLEFRLAAGRQFDRTYSFQIGRAVAAFGTCSEPSRLIKADKFWSVTTDVTYLQNYLQPGMETRFSVANVLTNTYNVPIWTKATLDIYYHTITPSRSLLAGSGMPTATTPDVALQHRTSNMSQHSGSNVLHQDSSGRRAGFSSGDELQSADVPSEVLPLTPPEAKDFNSLVSVSGDPGSPSLWPNVTFDLPSSLSTAGTIYRAQLLVVPKANGCEEFWAMNPPASLTNSSCGGVTTGDPYREVRVHIDGELAGFYPIYYTMYTGGVDPRLWTAIVASYAYSLPVYTFDLGPWLGLLNTAVDPASDQPHTMTVEILGATGSDWVLANTLLIWRSSDPDQIVTDLIKPWTAILPDARGGVDSSCEGRNLTEAGTCTTQVTARTLIAESMLKVGDSVWVSFVKYQLSRYSNVVTFDNNNGTSSWSQRTSHKAGWFTGIRHSAVPPSPPGDIRSDKRASWIAPQSGAACGRHVLDSKGGKDVSNPQAKRLRQKPTKIKRPGRMWDGRSDGKESVITQNARLYDWVNVGGQYDMAPFVFSYNETLQVPTVLAASPYGINAVPAVIITGRQSHYQQATMVNVYDTKQPACTVPTAATHSVVFNHSIGPIVSSSSGGSGGGGGGSNSGGSSNSSGGSKGSSRKTCKAWHATCAFCSPGLLVNELTVNDCLSQQ